MSSPREAARVSKQSKYMPIELCENGHKSERYTSSGACVVCRSINSLQYKRRHPERIKSARVQDRKKYKQARHAAELRRARTTYHERRLAITRRWQLENKEKYRECKRAYYHRAKKDVVKRLRWNIGNGLTMAMKGIKHTKSWTKFVPYNLSDLMAHLERQFTGDMTWENYGSYWHVDHIVPVSWFEQLPISVKKKLWFSFSLVNLRPCSKHANLSKHAKFIPALAIPVLKQLGLRKRTWECQTTQ